MIPTAPLSFPGSFFTAIAVTVIIGIIIFVASLLLKETHAAT